MNLSSEQVAWLKMAKDAKIADGNATYNDNPVLRDLIDAGLVTFSTVVGDDGELTAANFELTSKGKTELSLHRESEHRWFTEHWIAPLLTGFVSGVLVTLATTLLLGLLQFPA